MIKTKRVYEAAEPEDGFRLLVMRKWPRGVGKAVAHGWEKELGPSPQLLSDWRGGRIGWDQFKRRYIAELEGKEELMGSLVDRAQRQTVTLLCSCRDEERCHRTILQRFLMDKHDLM